MTNPVVTDLQITIGDWSARMASAPLWDDNGAGWFLGELDGWWGGQQVLSAPVTPPGRDGMIDGNVYFGARIITAAGHVVAPTRGKLQQAMRRIGGLLARGEQGDRWDTLVVDETADGFSSQATVRLNADTKVKPEAPFRAAWSITLFAEDPVKYGTVLQQVSTSRYTPGANLQVPLRVPLRFGPAGTSGFITADNRGDRATAPVVKFVGPLVDPMLAVVDGPRVSAQMTLNAGEVLEIDMRAATALLGGADREQFLGFDSSWFELPPGQSTMQFTAASGTGQVIVEWRDAWA